MKLIKAILLTTILIVPSLAFSSPVRFVKIILKRSGGGFGGPTYQVEILYTGWVHYQGYLDVKELGKRKTVIKKKQLLELQEMFTKSDYFNLHNQYINKKDGCDDYISDMDSATITIVMARRKKTIRHYLGCGAVSNKLYKLEEKIDSLVNAIQWVGRPEEWKISPAFIKTLQKANANITRSRSQ